MSSQESYWFTEQALTILKAVGNAITNFRNRDKFRVVLGELQVAHYPMVLSDRELTVQHFRVRPSARGPWGPPGWLAYVVSCLYVVSPEAEADGHSLWVFGLVPCRASSPGWLLH